MKLTKVSRERNDWHFWQVLVVCSGAEFLASGPSLVQSLELNSPDTRLVVLLTDGDSAARLLLRDLGQKLLSVALYEAQLETAVPCRDRYVHVAAILEMTQMHTLLLQVDSFVRRDLSLLPTELQKCDCSIPLRLERERSQDRVRLSSIWLAPTYNTQSLLKEATRYLHGHKAATLTEMVERKAFYNALVRCSDFVRLVPMPIKFCDRKDTASAYILSDLATRVADAHVREEQDRVKTRFDAPVTDIVYYPKQDVGTKAILKNNHFKLRLSRLSRPGRIYWRFMARFLAERAWSNGRNARIVALPQWEITPEELQKLGRDVSHIYLPHMIREQLRHPKARYYMQELLPDLFTVDENGWGAASKAFNCSDFLRHDPDPRLDAFLAKIRTSRITKAPQAKSQQGELPTFAILVPLQVPGDDALIHHANIDLEGFVETLAGFANRARVTVLFRKHPYDETTFYDRMKERFASEHVVFDSRGHIHDALEQAKAVAVINSGVGFEAMIYNKPLLSFGRAVYDEAVGRVTNDNIDDVYAQIISENEQTRTERYRRFISWYVFAVGIKINEQILNLAEDRIATPAYGENPVYPNLVADESADVRGVKVVKLKPKQPWMRLRARSEHMLRYWKRAFSRRWRRFRKTNTIQYDSKLKALFLRDLDESVFAGKTVALVGNASSLGLSANGAEIDRHDIVIRMNLGYPLTVRRDVDLADTDRKWVQGQFVDMKSTGREGFTLLRPDAPEDVARRLTNIQATGRKTDIWSCSTSDRNRQVTYAPVFDCTKVACHPAYHHLSWKLLLKNTVMRMPQSVFEDLTTSLQLEPTSGLIWIEYLTRTSMKSLDLYGFDFFASGHITRTTPNVLSASGTWPHDPAIERAYVFETVLKTDARVCLVTRDTLDTTA
ncbi:glycosyltransferase family 29 protein [Rhizobium sp. Leaf341]|uniref:glycosyltransferase family 29 protein n=1 Tax=Rhizobium sp. Leaf341 TaxID=1736344 RepID=UPI0007161001|nr:glycosyltransferase family 29 protein [Rhizobium sp. Leaf341]KQR75652.1 hypothetical protein ASG03_18365 [Rhizobium sp. Leaf341]